MERRRNLLIGIAVGVIFVAISGYATGLTRLVVSPFRSSSSTYKTSEAATAADLASGEWINSEPLKLKDLRGHVVLIEFWTFGCYNCRNTLPFIKGWYDRYHDKGLTLIGVHSPEFEEERTLSARRKNSDSVTTSSWRRCSASLTR